MNFNVSKDYRLANAGNLAKIALIVGAVGLVASAAGYFTDAAQFFHSYLVSFMFWTTIALGGLFFTMLHHVTGATWSVVVRRFSESAMAVLPLMAVFFIPILFGIHDIYHWSHEEAVAHDTILQKKAGYLSTEFFIIRAVFYFGVWTVLARILYKKSIAQDSNGEAGLTAALRRISAPGIVLFAVTLTFAAFDWLMSIDAHWYSTIFGVYVFGGTFLSTLCFITLMAQYVRNRNALLQEITVEHFHDLGKLMFAFTVFWTYIAYSQYFLIWYANIPEETVWFHARWAGAWKYFSLALLFGHFAVPFFVLMPRGSKRNMAIMKFMSIFILAMHWVDLNWIILPALQPEGARVSWMDLTTFIGLGGVFLWYYWQRFTSQAIIPVKDPKLQASIEFVNH